MSAHLLIAFLADTDGPDAGPGGPRQRRCTDLAVRPSEPLGAGGNSLAIGHRQDLRPPEGATLATPRPAAAPKWGLPGSEILDPPDLDRPGMGGMPEEDILAPDDVAVGGVPARWTAEEPTDRPHPLPAPRAARGAAPLVHGLDPGGPLVADHPRLLPMLPEGVPLPLGLAAPGGGDPPRDRPGRGPPRPLSQGSP